jgi:hypothetical protein
VIKFPQRWLCASKMKRRKRERGPFDDLFFFIATAESSLSDWVLTEFCFAYVVVVWTSRSNDDVTMFVLAANIYIATQRPQ